MRSRPRGDRATTHLISPEWDRSVFARTSRRMPGSPPTLQNGIRTAAFRRFDAPGWLRALFETSGMGWSTVLSVLRVVGVKGFVREMRAAWEREAAVRKDIWCW